MSIAFLRASRGAAACVCAILSVSLASCGGSSTSAPPPPLALTVSATDASTTLDVGETGSVTYTLVNPTSAPITQVQFEVDGGSEGGLKLTGVTCTSQGGACPPIAVGQATAFSMPAGASLALTASVLQVAPFNGVQAVAIRVSALTQVGEASATAHVSAADGRTGLYEIFTTSGLRSNLDVHFDTTPPTFSVSAGSADKTMASKPGYFVFPSGGHLGSGKDVLVGQADFGAGPDTFIAVRQFVTALADLDGASFSTFDVSSSLSDASGGPAVASGASLAVVQAAISGTTMTACEAPIGAIAGCDPARLHHFALTQAPDGGPAFTATGTDTAETFAFQVARSGSSLILLRADRNLAAGRFAIGFAAAQAVTAERTPVGSVGGVAGDAGSTFGLADFTATSLLFMPLAADGTFGPTALYGVTFSGGDDGIAGLLHGPRSTDAAEVFVLQQGALAVVGTSTGELGLLIDRY